jgi:hypothetical protein
MMNSLDLTAHAVKRMAQRGLADDDVELIRWIGTEVEGGYLVRYHSNVFSALRQFLGRFIKPVRKTDRRGAGAKKAPAGAAFDGTL